MISMFFLMISMFLLKNACTLIPKKKLPLQTFLRKLNRLATVRPLTLKDRLTTVRPRFALKDKRSLTSFAVRLI